MLGTLAHYKPGANDLAHAPELERLMLHRLVELDEQVRAAYAAYDYKKIVALLTPFMTSDLSAFYFDIRKDALYCDPPSSEKRKASLATIEQIFHCLTTWLAPILVFTAEEAWLSRYPDAASVHLELFPDVPSHWRDEALAKKWSDIRDIRAVVTGALELERAQKGSALRSKPRRLSISPIRNCALPWTAWISRKSASPPTSPSRPSARRQPRPSACPRRRASLSPSRRRRA